MCGASIEGYIYLVYHASNLFLHPQSIMNMKRDQNMTRNDTRHAPKPSLLGSFIHNIDSAVHVPNSSQAPNRFLLDLPCPPPTPISILLISSLSALELQSSSARPEEIGIFPGTGGGIPLLAEEAFGYIGLPLL